MKKFIFMLCCTAMLFLGGCGKDNSKGDEPVIDPTEWTWASLVKAYPFLSAFPEFKGDIENCQYREIGSTLKTVTFFDHNCSESVATTYYSSLSASGFTKSDGSDIYRKKKDNTTYIFTGSHSGGNFALSFSADSDN